MINISIIDDNEVALGMVQKCVEDLVSDREGVSVVGYRNSEVFLEEAKKRKCHILISDVDMPGMNGIETAKKARETNPRIFIIFVTAYMEFAIESYRIDAQQYILKEELAQRLPKVLIRLIDSLEKDRKDYCIIGSGVKKEKVLCDDIIWIKKEKGAKYVRYIMEDAELIERTTLENAVKKLDSSVFMIVERGYAINLKHVMKLKDRVLYLSNKDKAVVSKNRVASVKERLYKLWSEEEW